MCHDDKGSESAPPGSPANGARCYLKVPPPLPTAPTSTTVTLSTTARAAATVATATLT